MIALFGALREEVSDLRRRMGLEEVLPHPTCRVYKGEYLGRGLLLVQTGVGRQRAETATRLVLDRYAVTTLISTGFAGALAAELRVGDVVVCSTLHCAPGRGPGPTMPRPYHADEDLHRLATQALEGTTITFYTGSGVTVPQLIGTPEKRRDLARAIQAQIVDMESYWIAKIASDRKIPFVAARAISDTTRDTLPALDEMLAPDGGGQRRAAIAYLLRHPQSLAALAGLSWNVRVARRNLTTFADGLVAKL